MGGGVEATVHHAKQLINEAVSHFEKRLAKELN
jgi:hypothetical protein